MLGRRSLAPHLLASHSHAAEPMTSPAYDEAPAVRRWLPAVYCVGAIYCVVPFIETLGALWPPQLDSATWRYGAVGIFLSYVASIPLGLLIATVVARIMGHRVALRIIGAISILLAVLILVVVGAFALDVVQVRTIVRENVKGGFDLASAKAALMGLLVMVASILLAISSFRGAAKPSNTRRQSRNARTTGLVVGEPSSPLER